MPGSIVLFDSNAPKVLLHTAYPKLFSKVLFSSSRHNFVKVDVYYRQLKFESITQKEAFTIPMFFSKCRFFVIRFLLESAGEVGGNMGLLIGASAMTVAEVLDVFLFNLYLKYWKKKR